jgi:hypothetical protein
LAARSPRGVHIAGDQLQDLIVSGNVPPSPTGSEESERQIELSVRNQCMLATSFRAEDFTVVIDYVIATAERLQTYLSLLPEEPVGLVVLAPPLDVALARDQLRLEKQVLSVWTHLDAQIRGELTGRGLWPDTTDLSVDAVVEAIVARQSEARVDGTW